MSIVFLVLLTTALYIYIYILLFEVLFPTTINTFSSPISHYFLQLESNFLFIKTQKEC
jgi:hypothetical protein